MKNKFNTRFWEIDVLRGVAIVMMVTFHFIFDLNYFGIYDFNISSGFLWYFARTIAFTFIFLVGISLSLSYSRTILSKTYKTEKEIFSKYLKRGLKIFSYGLIITIMTWIFIREEFIVFGILHFIGIAIILEYPFLKRNYLNLILGILFIVSGLYLVRFNFDFSGLLWLGFVPYGFQTVDYFPLLPWIGVVSIGLFFGNLLYKDYTRRFNLPNISDSYFVKLFSFLGRNSLLIYLVHQPMLIIILYLFGVLDVHYLLR